MKYKISFLILGIIILFIGCSDSKSSKRSNNVVKNLREKSNNIDDKSKTKKVFFIYLKIHQKKVLISLKSISNKLKILTFHL